MQLFSSSPRPASTNHPCSSGASSSAGHVRKLILSNLIDFYYLLRFKALTISFLHLLHFRDEELALACDAACYQKYLGCKADCDSSTCERNCLSYYTGRFYVNVQSQISFKTASRAVPASRTAQTDVRDAQTRSARATSRKSTTAFTVIVWTKLLTIRKGA